MSTNIRKFCYHFKHHLNGILVRWVIHDSIDWLKSWNDDLIKPSKDRTYLIFNYVQSWEFTLVLFQILMPIAFAVTTWVPFYSSLPAKRWATKAR